MSIFSERLKECRKLRHMTQEELAAHIHSNRSTLSGYEGKSEKQPPFELVLEMASALSVSAAYLIGATNDIDGNTYVFPSDHYSFQETYNAMPRSMRPCVDPAFDALYRLMLPDIKSPDRDRLNLVCDLMRKIASMRSDIRSRIESSDGAMDIAAMAELMNLQDEFKSSVSSMIAELTQADIQAALRQKGKTLDTASSVAKAM